MREGDVMARAELMEENGEDGHGFDGRRAAARKLGTSCLIGM